MPFRSGPEGPNHEEERAGHDDADQGIQVSDPVAQEQGGEPGLKVSVTADKHQLVDRDQAEDAQPDQGGSDHPPGDLCPAPADQELGHLKAEDEGTEVAGHGRQSQELQRPRRKLTRVEKIHPAPVGVEIIKVNAKGQKEADLEQHRAQEIGVEKGRLRLSHPGRAGERDHSSENEAEDDIKRDCWTHPLPFSKLAQSLWPVKQPKRLEAGGMRLETLNSYIGRIVTATAPVAEFRTSTDFTDFTD